MFFLQVIGSNYTLVTDMVGTTSSDGLEAAWLVVYKTNTHKTSKKEATRVFRADHARGVFFCVFLCFSVFFCVSHMSENRENVYERIM
jgi:hypothetical protein